MSPSREVAVYVARIPNANPTTMENLRAMQPRITETAALILPGERLDAVAYGCTSASVVIGDDVVEAAIREAKPGVPCVTPPSAARAAFDALGVRRISVLTPYSREISAPFVAYFVARGLEVANLACFGLEDDTVMARVTPASVVEAAVQVVRPEAEALFVSCTAVRSAEVAEAIEARIGRPVVTSNQAMFWRCLRAAGCDLPVPGYGRLLRDA
jgi:maleate isomerase